MVTVGCDPEFLVINQITGRVQSFHGTLNDEHGNIGSDHGGRVGELRPKFGSPKEVTENLKFQIGWIKRTYPDIYMIAGGGMGFHESIGGHIHIGGVRLNSNYSSFTRMGARRRGVCELQLDTMVPDHKLIWALDFYIGRRMKKVPGGKRGGGSYGKPSDIETKSHGFEYRTPPSWISDPVLAESTLVVAKAIVELWQTKNTCFDAFIQLGKNIARRRDYNILIPTAGSDVAYVRRNVEAFKRIIFSKTYKMDSRELFDSWLVTKPVDQVTTSTTRRGSTRIELKVCQLKLVERTDEFVTETVAKVCRFALPEVKIHPLGDFVPWQLQLTNDIRLRPDTAYFSKELRPYLKVKRGKDIRVRFVDMNQRVVSANGETRVEALENVVLYNASRSTKDVLSLVFGIFQTGARTKLRNANDEDESEENDE